MRDTPHSGPPNPQSEIRDPKSLRLLVLEDSPADAELMVAALRRQGLEASWTRVDSEEDFVAALDESLDVILSDFNLPAFDALGAIAHVTRLGLSVPVIVVSGTMGEETAAACMREGAADYLLKDRLGRLGAAVTRAVERRRLEDQRRQVEAALLESQAELATVFDSAPVAMVILDRERRVVRANRAAAVLAERPAGNLFGLLPGEAFSCRHALGAPTACGGGPECQTCPLRAAVEATLREASVQRSVEYSLPVPSEEGEGGRTFLVSSSPIETAMGRLAVVVLEEVTELKRAEERERTLNRLLATIREVNQLIVRERRREWILAECCRILVERAGFAVAWIGEADHDAGVVRPVAVAGEPAGAEAVHRVAARLDVSREVCAPIASAIRERRTVVVSDLGSSELAGDWCKAAAALGYRSQATLPLDVSGRVFGAITISARRPEAFDAEAVALLEELAEDVGFALGALATAAEREAAVAALAESEERYRQLFEAESDAIVLVDNATGRILEANTAAEALYGYGRDELLALHNRDLSAEPEDTARVTTTSEVDPERMVRIPLRIHRRKDGSTVPVEVTGRFFTWQGRGVHVAAIRDISERRRTEQALERELELRRALAEVSRTVMQETTSVPEVAVSVLDQARRLTTAEHGFVSEVDPVTGDNVGHTLTEMLPDACRVGPDDQRIAFPCGADGVYPGLWGHALNTREPFFTNRVPDHPAVRGTPAGHVPLARYLAVPVVSGDELLGLIALANPARDFVAEDLEAVGRLADYYAVAVQKARAESALVASEERYRTLFEQSPVGIYRTTPDGRVIAANPALAQMLGYPSVEEVMAVDLEREGYAAPEGRRAFLERIDAGGTVSGHVAAWRARDGRTVFVRENARAVRDASGAVVHYEGTVEDITEATQARRERELLFDLAVDMFCISDFEGRLMQVNPACERILGWTPEELRSRAFLSFIHPDDREDALAAYATLGAGEQVVARENRVRCRDGSYRWLSWNAHPLPAEGLVFAVAHDTSERRRADEALRASEARYRSFFEEDLTADFIAELDGTLVECNPSFVKIFGFDDRDEALAVDLAALSSSASGGEGLLELAKAHGRLEQHELEMCRRDGSRLHVIANLGVLEDEAGRPRRIKGYLFDVTERRSLEEQLRHAQKMEAMGRLAGGVAHDFNNLLQAMMGTLQCLELESREGVTAVSELTEQVRQGAGLARQLLLFARREVTRTERLDLNGVVTASLRLLQRVLPANVSVSTELADGPLQVEADRGQVEQVVTNLVLNAGDAMPGGGRVAITTWGGDDEAGFEVGDTGEGIPDEIMGRIFEPFFTTKGRKGTGLGLAVVHGIVSQHGGRIGVESRVGEGARFRVAFPRPKHDEPVAPERPAPTGALPRGQGQKVLVVEDNEQIRMLFARMLERLGYRASTVASAEEALDRSEGGELDLLITDLMLPGMTGVELAQNLRERRPGLKVIVMSGYAEDEALRHDLSSGRTRFLQKPIGLEALAREVHAALA